MRHYYPPAGWSMPLREFTRSLITPQFHTRRAYAGPRNATIPRAKMLIIDVIGLPLF